MTIWKYKHLEPRDYEMNIIKKVCGKHKTNLENMLEVKGSRELTQARAEAMILLREKGLTYKRIGYLFWNRNHAAVIYLIKKYNMSNIIYKQDRTMSENEIPILCWDCNKCWIETEHTAKYTRDCKTIAVCKECDSINGAYLMDWVFTKI